MDVMKFMIFVLLLLLVDLLDLLHHLLDQVTAGAVAVLLVAPLLDWRSCHVTAVIVDAGIDHLDGQCCRFNVC